MDFCRRGNLAVMSLGGSLEGGSPTPSNMEYPPQYSTKNIKREIAAVARDKGAPSQ